MDKAMFGTIVGLVVAAVAFVALLYYRQGRLEEGIVDIHQHMGRIDDDLRETRREFREEWYKLHPFLGCTEGYVVVGLFVAIFTLVFGGIAYLPNF